MREHDWSKKYSAALLERNRSLSMIRIDEAYKAIPKRTQEIPETCNERQKFMKKPTDSRHDRFGLFELNLQTGELWKRGVKTRLGQQAVFSITASTRRFTIFELPWGTLPSTRATSKL